MVPVAAGYAVVSGLELAAADDAVVAAADVDAVPAFRDEQILKDGILQRIAQEGIIGRPGDVDAAHMEVLGFGHYDGVRAAHILFSALVKYVHAVNGSFSGDGGVLDAGANEEGLHPLAVVDAVGIGRSVAAVIAGKVVLRDVRLIGIRVLHAL